jgi:hypothetical protein
MKIKQILAVSALILGSVVFVAVKDDPDCVNVYVDFSSLDKNSKLSKCIPISGQDTALNILAKTDIELAGTDKYGLAVVCRVNNLPGSDKESCLVMPPEDAFWAFIIKNKMSATNLFPKWGWAQKGVSEVYLTPGDSLGLVFSEKGDLKWPD